MLDGVLVLQAIEELHVHGTRKLADSVACQYNKIDSLRLIEVSTLTANSPTTNSKKSKDILQRIVIGVCVALVGVIFTLTPWGMESEQEMGLGWLFSARGPAKAPPDVFVVSMDSESADKLGQSTRLHSWERVLHAELIDQLVRREVAVVVFDIFFESMSNAAEDEKLIDAIKRSQRTVLFQLVLRKEENQIVTSTLVSPAKEYAAASIGLAPFPLPKTSNRINQYWLFHDDTGDTPTLPMVALQVQAINVVGYDRFVNLVGQAEVIATDELPASIHHATHTKSLVTKLKTAFRQNPGALQRYMRVLENEAAGLSPVGKRVMRALGTAYDSGNSNYVNFYGPPRTITTIPYHTFREVDDSMAFPYELKDAIVFIGASAQEPSSQQDGFFTVYSTSNGLDLEGVEIAASIAGNQLDQNAVRSLEIVNILGIVFVFGLLLSTAALGVPGFTGAVISILIGTCWFMIAVRLFATSFVWLPLFIPLIVQLPMALVAGLLWQYLSVRQARESIAKAMSRYFPESFVEQIAQGSNLNSNDSEVIHACCLCSDVQDYTALSERLSPEKLKFLTNEYFGHVGSCIKERDGQVMNFVGDGATCMWKMSEQSKPARMQASLAALDILSSVRKFNEMHPDERFQTRIGLHVGTVAIGDTGGGGHFNYGIQGDTINAASRIEQLNKKLGTFLLASAEVVKDLDILLVRRLGDFVLKGKTEILTLVEIVERRERATRNQYDLCRRFSFAMEQFDKQHWLEASELFTQLLLQFPEDGPALFYHSLCRDYLASAVGLNRNSVIHLKTK